MSDIKSVKLAHLVKFGNGQDWKSVEAQDGEFPVYGSGGKFGLASDFLHDGEAVLFGRKGTVDRPIYVNEKFWTVDTMYYAIPHRDRCSGKYLYYWATTIPFKTITTNTALPSVTSMDLSQLYVPLPPLEKQQRIADYLDVETAQIDTTVSTLDKLIEEMKSRRVQLIGNTIKLSGYPETPLKYIVINRFAGEWGKAEGDSEVDLPCIRVADFDRSTNTVSDDVPTTRSVERNVAEKKRLCLHDILLEKSGGGEKTPVGTPILYTGGNNAICSNFIEVIRLNPGHEPRYWVYALAGSYESGSTRRLVNQTTGIQNVDLQLYFDESFPVPPVEKQVELADFLDIETAKIDKIISTATELRSELLARRSVLITEVVTGQRQV